MKKVTKKQCLELLNKIAVYKEFEVKDINNPNGWYVKLDNSYLGDDEYCIEEFIEKGVIEQIQNSGNREDLADIGFNPVEQKWYGFNYMDTKGFGIGSEIKKGDVGYKPSNKEEFIEKSVEFWKHDNGKTSLRGEEVEINGVLRCKISWEYTNKMANRSLWGKTNSTVLKFPDKWGRGEWKAETLEDAKEMAKDFAEY